MASSASMTTTIPVEPLDKTLITEHKPKSFAQALGRYTHGVYKNYSPEEIEFIVHHCNAPELQFIDKIKDDDIDKILALDEKKIESIELEFKEGVRDTDTDWEHVRGIAVQLGIPSLIQRQPLPSRQIKTLVEDYKRIFPSRDKALAFNKKAKNVNVLDSRLKNQLKPERITNDFPPPLVDPKLLDMWTTRLIFILNNVTLKIDNRPVTAEDKDLTTATLDFESQKKLELLLKDMLKQAKRDLLSSSSIRPEILVALPGLRLFQKDEKDTELLESKLIKSYMQNNVLGELMLQVREKAPLLKQKHLVAQSYMQSLICSPSAPISLDNEVKAYYESARSSTAAQLARALVVKETTEEDLINLIKSDINRSDDIRLNKIRLEFWVQVAMQLVSSNHFDQACTIVRFVTLQQKKLSTPKEICKLSNSAEETLVHVQTKIYEYLDRPLVGEDARVEEKLEEKRELESFISAQDNQLLIQRFLELVKSKTLALSEPEEKDITTFLEKQKNCTIWKIDARLARALSLIHIKLSPFHVVKKISVAPIQHMLRGYPDPTTGDRTLLRAVRSDLCTALTPQDPPLPSLKILKMRLEFWLYATECAIANNDIERARVIYTQVKIGLRQFNTITLTHSSLETLKYIEELLQPTGAAEEAKTVERADMESLQRLQTTHEESEAKRSAPLTLTDCLATRDELCQHVFYVDDLMHEISESKFIDEPTRRDLLFMLDQHQHSADLLNIEKANSQLTIYLMDQINMAVREKNQEKLQKYFTILYRMGEVNVCQAYYDVAKFTLVCTDVINRRLIPDVPSRSGVFHELTPAETNALTKSGSGVHALSLLRRSPSPIIKKFELASIPELIKNLLNPKYPSEFESDLLMIPLNYIAQLTNRSAGEMTAYRGKGESVARKASATASP